jgi:hypothetical protein
LLRLRQGGRLPANYSSSKLSELIYRLRVRFLALLKGRSQDEIARLNAFLKKIFRGAKRRVLYNHIKPQRIIERKGEAFFKDAFVVTMCRHPYDVLLSRVYWEKHKKEGVAEFDIESVIDEMLENEPLNQDYYFLNGDYLPDFVIRYEHMQEDLQALEQKFGLSLVANLPFTKNKVRQEKKSGADVLTEKQKEICFNKNRLVFDKFGYER